VSGDYSVTTAGCLERLGLHTRDLEQFVGLELSEAHALAERLGLKVVLLLAAAIVLGFPSVVASMKGGTVVSSPNASAQRGPRHPPVSDGLAQRHGPAAAELETTARVTQL
jgi:hypothetical protein